MATGTAAPAPDWAAAYRGRRVLLTGHTGFKGSWLLALLHELGADVTGYALPPDADQRLYAMIGGERLCHSAYGDLRDWETLQAVVQRAAPDYVFHLAAQSLVRRSYAQPVETFAVNTQGTVHLLEAVRQLQRPLSVVCVTTDKVYENAEDGRPMAEGDPLGGWDPYSASKAAAEVAIASYRRAFFSVGGPRVGLASARAGNVIGGGDYSADRIVPDLVRALEAARPLGIRNPAAVRPWQHVLEPLVGYLQLGAALAAKPGVHSTAYNFGPHTRDCLPVGQLVQLALQAWGVDDPARHAAAAPDATAPHEAGLLLLDATRAQTELHWRPRLDAAQAVQWTMDWYRHAPADAAAYTRLQIRQYLGG